MLDAMHAHHVDNLTGAPTAVLAGTVPEPGWSGCCCWLLVAVAATMVPEAGLENTTQQSAPGTQPVCGETASRKLLVAVAAMPLEQWAAGQIEGDRATWEAVIMATKGALVVCHWSLREWPQLHRLLPPVLSR